MSREPGATIDFVCSRCSGVNVERSLGPSDDLILGKYQPIVYSCAWCKHISISHVVTGVK